mmetsp:Transcript_22967/g.47922  ORF Transcript_22967/g.47922 Transcript_22967/m.47922 type:complete len:162 (+) Transcript_22967:226-711(+)
MINLPVEKKRLHAVLALDPGGNVGAPCQRSSETSSNIVPFDPGSRSKGTGFLLESKALGARESAGSQEDETEETKSDRRHLGHDGSENRRRRVLSFPVGVFRHAQGNRLLGDERSTGRSGRGESLGGGDEKGAKDEAELGHGYCCEEILRAREVKISGVRK